MSRLTVYAIIYIYIFCNLFVHLKSQKYVITVLFTKSEFDTYKDVTPRMNLEQHYGFCFFLLPLFSVLNHVLHLISKMYLLKGKTSKSRETMFWRQYWRRRLSLVPKVFRVWHVYWRWTGLKNTHVAYLTPLCADKEI